MPYLLGIDIGGTMVKAALYTPEGEEVALSGSHTPLLTPQPCCTERDLDGLFRQVCEAIREILAQSGARGEEVVGLACCGHGKGLYLWGNRGPVRHGIVSTDSRASGILERWNRDGTAELAYTRTGQRLMVSHSCVLLRWLKEYETASYRAVQWVFEAKDYIRFRLTGKALAERTDYSGTGFMNMQTQSFDPELFRQYGIPEMLEHMPPLRGSFDECGYVTKETARATGLCAGTPVAGGLFDIDACALAMGIRDGSRLCCVTGTWSINEYIAPAPVTDGSVALNSLYCLPNMYLIEESSPTSAGNLEWLVRHVFDDEGEKAVKEKRSVYQRMDSLAEQVGPEASRVCYLPYIFGGTDNPLARGVFAGLDASDGRAEMVRAVFEGVVFGHRTHIERLLASRKNSKPDGIRLSGGGARSSVWVQMFADVMQLPVEVVKVQELGTLGSAICAAVTCGMYADVFTAMERMTPNPVVIMPNTENMEVYHRKYQVYCMLVKSLEAFWVA